MYVWYHSERSKKFERDMSRGVFRACPTQTMVVKEKLANHDFSLKFCSLVEFGNLNFRGVRGTRLPIVSTNFSVTSVFKICENSLSWAKESFYQLQ